MHTEKTTRTPAASCMTHGQHGWAYAGNNVPARARALPAAHPHTRLLEQRPGGILCEHCAPQVQVAGAHDGSCREAAGCQAGHAIMMIIRPVQHLLRLQPMHVGFEAAALPSSICLQWTAGSVVLEGAGAVSSAGRLPNAFCGQM